MQSCGSGGISKAERVKKFKNMLLNGNKYEEIFEANEILLNSSGINTLNQFKTLLEGTITNHQFFNFIEIF